MFYFPVCSFLCFGTGRAFITKFTALRAHSSSLADILAMVKPLSTKAIHMIRDIHLNGEANNPNFCE